MIKIRGHHLKKIHKVIKEYKENGLPNKNVELYRSIIEESKTKIVIVRTLDNFCNSCPKYKENCKEEIDDSSFAKYYGLKINQTYSSEGLIKKLKEKLFPPNL